MKNPFERDPAIMRERTPQELILSLAKRKRIGIFFDSKAQRNGLAWIIFQKNGMCLAEFYDETDALAWFPKKAGIEGKP